jgi:FixJ family two-component response regulator
MGRSAGVVFVVDDDGEVRAGLSRLLGAAGYQVRTFDSAESFLVGHDDEMQGCLLLDINMPGMSGLELQRTLDGLSSRPIVFLTGHGDIPASVRAMKEGAVDFLTKPFDPMQLCAALDQALQRDGEQRIERARLADVQRRLRTLTRRERQVMEGVVRGLLNKQIAGELAIDEKTVKVHRGRVMSKMRMRSLADLVRLVSGAPVDAPSRSAERSGVCMPAVQTSRN